MGLPMICSNQVQAATAYLKEGGNGFSFDPYKEDALSDCFCEIMNSSDDSLAKMGKSGRDLGMLYTTTDWVETLLTMKRMM